MAHYNHLLPGQETWGAAGNQFPELVDAAFDPAQNIPPPFRPCRPTDSDILQSFEQSWFDGFEFTAPHDLQPAGRSDPGQSGGDSDCAGRAGAADPMLDLPAVTAIYAVFKPASDAEYQARVVMQAAVADFNDDPLTRR